MRARHNGQCNSCYERITPGDIIWNRNKGWMHMSCATDYDNEQHKAAQPKEWVQQELFGNMDAARRRIRSKKQQATQLAQWDKQTEEIPEEIPF